jgi:hypothetical protein
MFVDNCCQNIGIPFELPSSEPLSLIALSVDESGVDVGNDACLCW